MVQGGKVHENKAALARTPVSWKGKWDIDGLFREDRKLLGCLLEAVHDDTHHSAGEDVHPGFPKWVLEKREKLGVVYPDVAACWPPQLFGELPVARETVSLPVLVEILVPAATQFSYVFTPRVVHDDLLP
jgi:hypothetical protein